RRGPDGRLSPEDTSWVASHRRRQKKSQGLSVVPLPSFLQEAGTALEASRGPIAAPFCSIRLFDEPISRCQRHGARSSDRSIPLYAPFRPVGPIRVGTNPSRLASSCNHSVAQLYSRSMQFRQISCLQSAVASDVASVGNSQLQTNQSCREHRPPLVSADDRANCRQYRASVWWFRSPHHSSRKFAMR